MIATTGLLSVILFSGAFGRPEAGPFAVGAWLVGAIMISPSGALANPAIVFGTFVERAPGLSLSAGYWAYTSAEVLGLLVALSLTKMAALTRVAHAA